MSTDINDTVLPRITESQRGKPLLLHNGYSYYLRKKNRQNEISWICTQKNCYHSVKTNEDRSQITYVSSVEHQHPELTEAKMETSEVDSILKKDATDDVATNPQELTETALASYLHISTQNVKQSRKNMHHSRKKLVSKVSEEDDQNETASHVLDQQNEITIRKVCNQIEKRVAYPSDQQDTCETNVMIGPIKIIESQRGRPLVIYNGYSYYIKKRNTRNEILWKCTRKNCWCSVKTNEERSYITYISKTQHLHPPLTEEKIEALQVNCTLKKKATEDIYAKPQKLIRNALASCQYVSAINIKQFRENMHRSRKKLMPKVSEQVRSSVDQQNETVTDMRDDQNETVTRKRNQQKKADETKRNGREKPVTQQSDQQDISRAEDVKIGPIKIIESRRGRPLLLHDGYSYCIKKINTRNETLWKCTRKDCCCSVKTNEERSHITYISKTQHLHPPLTEEKIETLQVNSTLKKKATEDIYAKPEKLIKNALASCQYVSAENMKRFRENMYHSRRKFVLKFPSSVLEATEEYPQNQHSTGGADDVKIIERQRGKPLLIHNGYSYRVRKSNLQNEILWTCAQNSCYCSLKTNEEKTHITRLFNVEHKHPELTEEKIEELELSSALKRKAIEDDSVSPQELMQTALTSCDAQDEKRFRKNLYYNSGCELLAPSCDQQNDTHIVDLHGYLTMKACDLQMSEES